MDDSRYMEVPGFDRPFALCSDDQCPCGQPGATIARGGGFMYVSRAVAEFRNDCPTEAEAQRKLQRMESQLGGAIVGGAGVFAPVLMCALGARQRGLNLEIAAADAAEWWRSGRVPIRESPLATSTPPPSAAAAAGTAPHQPAQAGNATTDPAAAKAALAQLLKALAAGALIPPRAASVMRDIEVTVDRNRKTAMVGVAVAVIAAIVAGAAAGSFWIGGAVLVVGFGLSEVFNRASARRGIGQVSRQHGAPDTECTALFRNVRIERTLMRLLLDQAKGLENQPLSNDIAKRVSEALLLAMIKTLLEQVLTPSRDVAGSKEKWRPVKELADKTNASTALIGKCRNMIFNVQRVLENRELMFQTLDRIAAAMESPAGV